MDTIDYKKLKPTHYYRKSTEAEDRQALSLDSQKSECERTASFYNLPTPIAVIEEAKSAKIAGKRPQFTVMVNDIISSKVDAIVCWHINRLARNMTEGGVIIDLLSSGQLKAIITPTEVFNQNTDVSIMSLYFGASKQYSKNLSRDVKRGQTKKASMGVPHGVATLGFINDKTEEKGNRRWLVDKERLEKIRLLLRMFLTGEWSAGKLHRYAVKELKLTTVKRKKIGGQLIQLSRIYEILKDTTYAGFFFYNGERYELDKNLPRLITEDEHKMIKIILGKRNIPKVQKHEATFSGFISSPENDFIGLDRKYQVICDCKFKFAHRDKTHCPKCNKSIDEMEKPKYLDYSYYYNISKKKSGLKYKSTNDDDLTSFVIAEIGQKIPFSTELANWSRKHIKEMRDEEVNENLFKEEIAQQEAGDYISKKKRLREMLADKMITDDEYKTDLIDLEARYKSTEKPKIIDWTIRANEIVNLAEEFVTVMTDGQISAKRSILTKLGSNLVWNDEKLSIINKKPVQALIDGWFQIKMINPEFEPKNSPLFTTSNEKTDEFSSVFSTLLRDQGSNLGPSD